MKRAALAALIFFGAFPVPACIWDRDSLAEEKKKSPDLAAVILGPPPPAPINRPALEARINQLKAKPDKESPSWWNDLAGAYLRLGNVNEVVQLLEPVSSTFPNDYGIHANLGTAYHLLGRYKDAEREIGRDLQINPEGHFGLEKYHLALLQYLSRDESYQKTHVYVDEFTPALFGPWDELGLMPRVRNLKDHSRLREGVIYMATLNAKQPACFVMLGLVAMNADGYARDLNLAAAAFEKAIKLGSPQRDILTERIRLMRRHTGS